MQKQHALSVALSTKLDQSWCKSIGVSHSQSNGTLLKYCANPADGLKVKAVANVDKRSVDLHTSLKPEALNGCVRHVHAAFYSLM